MQEYFAQRMARLKKERGREESSTAPEEASPVCSHNEGSRKKRSKNAVGKLEEVESSSTPMVTEEDTNQEPDHPRKKKKKRKAAEKHETRIVTSDLGHNLEELPPKKKSRKHDADSRQINGQAEQQTVKCEVTTGTDEVDDVIREEEEMMKKKKKKKKSKKKRKNPE